MKKVFLGLVATILISFTFTSCESENQKSNKKDTTTGRWYIHYADWDDWGRTSRNCAGWGLCHYTDCWFCDVNDKHHRGKVVFDEETRDGFLIIELDPTDDIQYVAIKEQKIFYVDDDIDNPNSILHKGEYEFDKEIGEFGGYKLDITVKKN